jgi:hypothetical protein
MIFDPKPGQIWRYITGDEYVIESVDGNDVYLHVRSTGKRPAKYPYNKNTPGTEAGFWEMIGIIGVCAVCEGTPEAMDYLCEACRNG